MAQRAQLEIHADLKALRKELKQAVSEFRAFNQDAIRAASGVGKLEKAAESAGKQVGFFNTGLGKMAVAIGGGFIGAGAITRIVGFFKNWGRAILGSSSALQELDSKARIVFGETFPQVEARVAAIADEVGRADSAILQYAADLGAVIDAAGLTKEATAGMSTEFAKLAVDLASFHNTTDIEAFNALRSAITGELEPLKRFGVVMTQANLQAYALEKGIKQKIETMSQAQLTALRYNYILARTQTAQGDAARTADSYANQARRLKGEITELNEQLGRSATPALATGLSVLNSVIQNVRMFVGFLIQDIRSLFALLNVSVGGADFGKAVKSAVSNIVGSVPVIGPMLRNGGKLVGDRIGQRMQDERSKPSFQRPDFNVPTQYQATGVKSLQEMMDEYAGAGASGGGGKGEDPEAVLRELERAEQDILKAISEQARANLDNLRMRREDLQLRHKLGILTRAEDEELRRINNRLEFKGELIDDLTKKWEENQRAIEASADRLEELRKELRNLEEDASENRVEMIAELIEERNDIRKKTGGATDLSGDDSFRLGEIEGELAGASADELAEGERRAGLSDIDKASDEEKRKKAEIMDLIEQERAKMADLKSQAQDTQRAIVDAINDRYSKSSATHRLIEEDTRVHVQRQIDELSKLESKYRSLSMSYGKLPIPSSGSVTTNSSQTINVNQNNYGEAAKAATDPARIRWEMRKAA